MGMGTSASAGALLSSTTSPMSASSPMSISATPLLGGSPLVSAMAMDVSRGRERSPSPGPGRRQLIESSSAPKLGLGDSLPPLQIGGSFRDEASRTSPASAFGVPGRRAYGLGASSAMPGNALHRTPGRILIKDDENSWHAARTKNVDDVITGKAVGINGNPRDGGITGWALSGHSVEGSQLDAATSRAT